MQFTVAATLKYIWLEPAININQQFHPEGNIWYLSCFVERKIIIKLLELDKKSLKILMYIVLTMLPLKFSILKLQNRNFMFG